jgi:hypothetical protein
VRFVAGASWTISPAGMQGLEIKLRLGNTARRAGVPNLRGGMAGKLRLDAFV